MNNKCVLCNKEMIFKDISDLLERGYSKMQVKDELIKFDAYFCEQHNTGEIVYFIEEGYKEKLRGRCI